VNNAHFLYETVTLSDSERPQVTMQQYSLLLFKMEFIIIYNFLDDVPHIMYIYGYF